MSSKIRTRKYEEMFPDEVFAELAVNPVIYLAFGGLEVHGPHNPLGIDMLPFYGIALEAAEKTGGIVHPPVYMAVPCWPALTSAELRKTTLNLGPPSVWHGRDLLEAWLDATLWNFDKMGFKICVLLPGHVPNIRVAHEWCKKKNGRFGELALVVCDCLPMIAPAGFTSAEMGHGAMMESAWQEELYPGTVDLKRIQQAIERDPDVKALDARYAWDSRKFQSYTRITVEKGRKFVNMTVDWIVREVARQKVRLSYGPTRWDIIDAGPFLTRGWQVSNCMPKTGDVSQAPCFRLADKSLGWQALASDDPDSGRIGVHALYGERDGLVYLANRIKMPETGRIEVRLGHDGGARLFIDGQSVLCDPRSRGGITPDRSRATIDLAEGEHEMVVAFDLEHGAGWGIRLRFAAADGKFIRESEFPSPVLFATPVCL